MPRRPATPPIDDGAKYLTVVYPYPSRPNMEFESHRKLFAQWVAACIGSEYLRAFYHKPTSPGSIIMEIEESLPDFQQILGAHQWSQFLAAPQGDDAKHVSKVFYCTYNSDRLVQKNGWKRIDVKESYFRSKHPSKFVSPYPPTQWCDLPKVGNVIQNDLCRPLPGGNFPPPPPPEPAPVVGTLEWSEWKRQQGARPPPVKTWRRGAPLESLHTAGQSALGPPTQAVQPAPRRAWANVVTGPSGLPPDLLRANSTVSSRGSSSSGTGANTPSIRSISPLPPKSSSSSSGTDNNPLSPTDGVYGCEVAVAGVDVEGALDALYLDGEDDSDGDFYSVYGPTSTIGDTLGNITIAPATSIKESLWGGYVDKEDDEDEDDPEDNDLDLIKAAKKQPGLCRAHNRVCKKGICKIYAAQLHEEEKERRKAERMQQREAREHARETRTRKSPGGEDASSPPSRSGANTPARAPPPHLRAGAPAPDAGPPRQLPPHLRRGAAPPPAPSPSSVSRISSPAGASPAPPSNASDDARSVSSSGRSSAPSGVWGANAKSRGTALSRASAANVATNRTPASAPAPAPPRAFGAWGKAPSISTSSVQRNNDSWSVSARSDDDDEDVQSVAGRSEASGWGTKSDRDGPWGNTNAVRSAAHASTRAPSVAGSAVSKASTAQTWGNVSAGPW